MSRIDLEARPDDLNGHLMLVLSVPPVAMWMHHNDPFAAAFSLALRRASAMIASGFSSPVV